MSWENYLALSVRRRWVMHSELIEMVSVKDQDDDGEPKAEIQPKRFMR